jgi:hypothetical protein
MTNRCGRDASVTTDRSWNVPFSAVPEDVNVVPTVAGPSGASRVRSLNLSSLARSPDHSRCARRSAIVS